MVASLLLTLPAAHAAELAIRVVVVKSARVSVQGLQRIAVTTRDPEAVQVTVQPAEHGGLRVVFTP